MEFGEAKKWIWWYEANNRRCDLIEKKHLGDEFTAADERELRVLQAMADVIVSLSFGSTEPQMNLECDGQLKAERDRYKATLEKAIAAVEDWASYAPDWAKDKHGYDEELAELKASLNPKSDQEGK